MRAWLLVLAGCWTGTIAPAAPRRCASRLVPGVIRDASDNPAGRITGDAKPPLVR